MRRARTLTSLRRAAATHAIALTALGCGVDGGLPTAPADAARDAGRAPLVCLADGAREGGWLVGFNGYGCAQVARGPGGATLTLSPRAATAPASTHAQLLLGPASAADVDFRVAVRTERQLRTGSAPNPWEVAWVVWHHTDDAHFYYFIAKPNGWELGKRDPSYPGGQRFLATGDDTRFPVGGWYDVRVAQHGATITVHVDGAALATFTDDERPYRAGRVGVYSEDAAVVARVE